jgi:hypothetical protein
MATWEFPVEVCCPLCHEVVMLIERPIPGSEKLKNILNYCDTPIKVTDKITRCPACHKRYRGSIAGFGSFLFPYYGGFISVMKAELKAHRGSLN